MIGISEALKKCELFSGLDEAALKSLGDKVAMRSYAEGSVLFSEGEVAASLFILAEGSVYLIKSTPGGREQLVRQVNPGEMFAEAAMFAGTVYPVSAVAKCDSTLLCITKTSFLMTVKDHPDVALSIMGTMAKLLRHLNKLVSDLSLGSVSQRLARYLLNESTRRRTKAFDLPIPKRELAFKLGTVPETLSRTFRKLASKNLITVRGVRIIINDIKLLENTSKN